MIYLDLAFIFIFSIFLYWFYGLIKALKSDAPFLPIRRDVLDRMLTMVDPKPGSVWMDLGSGDGRILIEAAKKFSFTTFGQNSNRIIIKSGKKKAIVCLKKGDSIEII